MLLLGLAASAAHADTDWASGMVTARGVGVANRAAPNPATARGPARRLAVESAKKSLATQIAALPLAAGGTVGTSAAVTRAIDDALELTAEPQTDGSWVITMGVPTEAIRQAIAGPRKVALATADTAPPVVIVDGATATPAIGWTVGKVAAPTLFVKTAPAWAKGAPHVTASGASAGDIAVGGSTGGASTLYLVVQ